MRFQDPLAIACPHCSTEQMQSVSSLLELVATCNYCSKELNEVGEGMRSQVNDWASYVGRIELAMALEHRFNCSISDEELEAADTANAYVSLIRRKVGGLTDDQVLSEICEAMRGIRPELTEPTILAQPIRALLSTYRRADA